MYRWWSLLDDALLVEFMYCWWSLCTAGGVCVPLVELSEDVTLVEFMYLVFTRMPGESYRRRLGSLFVVFV